MAINTQHSGVQPPDPNAKTKALSALRQATWEATQFLSYDEVNEFVNDVLYEVQTDEP